MGAVQSAAPEETASPPAEAAGEQESPAKRARVAGEIDLGELAFEEHAGMTWDECLFLREWHLDQLLHVEAGALIVSS